jgi:CDP-glycerol glycerophosphotransferase
VLKIICIKIVSLMLKIFWIFPIKKNRIIFISYAGVNINCNPKYIYKYMQNTNLTCEYIWVAEKFDEFSTNKSNTKFVVNKSFYYYYYALTSAVYITNDGLSAVLPFRKKQTIINTWHGGGNYKSSGMGGNSQINLSDQYSISKMAKSLTWFISSSKVFSVNMEKFYLIPENKILSIGMPRNDQFFSISKDDKIKREVRKKFNIDDRCGIVLYTPTFRGSASGNEENGFDINIDKLKKSLEDRFRKPFKIVYRMHHAAERPTVNDDVIDGSDYIDSQHLLQAADILISDYSSILWDFSLTMKPSFIFAPDLGKYTTEDRGFTSEISSWPFPVAENNQELAHNISCFDDQDYQKMITKHHQNLGSFETGSATKKICTLITELL